MDKLSIRSSAKTDVISTLESLDDLYAKEEEYPTCILCPCALQAGKHCVAEDSVNGSTDTSAILTEPKEATLKDTSKLTPFVRFIYL